MSTYFLFMDESYGDKTQISSLTGILVSVSRYAQIRSDFYKIIMPYIKSKEGGFHLGPIELHGKAFLPDASDQEKVEVYGKVIKLVAKHKLKIYRVGYYITKGLAKQFQGDSRLLNLCWFGLMAKVQDTLQKHFVIPVMDGLDMSIAKHFMATTKGAEVQDQVGLNYRPDIKMNLTGEVLFTDSEHSIFIQMADLVSYIFSINDLVREGFTVSSFKDKVHGEIHILSKRQVFEKVLTMTLNDVVHEPNYKKNRDKNK